MRFRKQYDEVAQLRLSRLSSIDTGTEDFTDQSAAKDLDINEIARRCGAGPDPSLARVAAAMSDLGLTAGAQPFFGDFSLGLTLHESMNALKRAESAFMELPASARGQFRNQVGFMLDAIEAAKGGDKEALADLEKSGLLDVPAVPAPAAVPAQAAAAPAADKAAPQGVVAP